MRTLLVAVMLGLAGCDVYEPTLGGTITSVVEAPRAQEAAEESPKYYDPPLVPEVAWKAEVRLDDGRTVTVTTEKARQPGDRVRLLMDEDGELLL